MAIEDRDLILRILAGERELFDTLMRRHGTSLFQTALAVLNDRHEAEEAVQEAFLKAYRSLSSFQGRSSFRTWATRITLNQCKDMIRRKTKRPFLSLEKFLEEGNPEPEDPGLNGKDEENIDRPDLTEKMMSSLNRGEKSLIKAMREKGLLTSAQLGKELGLSVDGVKSKLKRARKKLKEYLNRGDGDDS